MLLPEGFWMMFTLIVVGGMAATSVVAALIAALMSERTAPHPSKIHRPVSQLPTPATRAPRVVHDRGVPAPDRRAG